MNSVGGLATVAVYRDPWVAHIDRGRLQAEDIPAWLIHEHHVWMQWSIAQAIGGVKLLVPRAERDAALRILEGVKSGEYDGLLDGYQPVFDAGPCGRCGSSDPAPAFSLGTWLLLVGLFLMLGVTFPAHRARNRCRACGHTWNRDLNYDG